MLGLPHFQGLWRICRSYQQSLEAWSHLLVAGTGGHGFSQVQGSRELLVEGRTPTHLNGN